MNGKLIIYTHLSIHYETEGTLKSKDIYKREVLLIVKAMYSLLHSDYSLLRNLGSFEGTLKSKDIYRREVLLIVKAMYSLLHSGYSLLRNLGSFGVIVLIFHFSRW